MADPLTVYDLEFVFASGARLTLTAHTHRDTLSADDARIRVLMRPDNTTIDEVIVDRTKLDYFRTTQRTLPTD
jgi:hypothetical protein